MPTEAGNGEDPFADLGLGAPEGFGKEHFPQPERLPGDLYPENTDDYDNLLKWCVSAFDAADRARTEHARRWSRYYRQYRSYVERKPGDWHSIVFVPIAFWVIETVTPRLVAQLPAFTCAPVGPEDVQASNQLEVLLDYAVKQSGLYEQLVMAFKSALKYGTGILKTYHRQDMRRARKHLPIEAPLIRPQQVPVTDDSGMPLLDLDGSPVVETRETLVGTLPMGTQSQTYQYTAYEGPAAECIDIFNFWPAPEAYDIDSARYVIHRTYKPMSYIKRRVAEGIYHMPSNMDADEMASTDDQPNLERLASIGLGGGGRNVDATYKPVELLEFWTDDGRVVTMANRKALLRVQENPFDHSEKPFVRITDYPQEHEFWGIGEIEPIEGIQDAHNAIVNTRIDNLRLIINSMFFVNTNHVEDMKDFVMRPGGIIRGKGEMRPEETFQRIDLGDVTQSAFQETEMLDQVVQRVTGVSDYTMGMSTSSMNDTATGTAIVQEQGATRFGMKTKHIEITALDRLGRQFGSILQQFLSEERQVRLDAIDPQTQQPIFASFGPESIQGAIDVYIQAESTTMSQTMKVEQKQNLLGLIAQFAPQGVLSALDEVLEAMGIKDKERFLYGDPMQNMQAIQAQAQMQQAQMQADMQMQAMQMQQQQAMGMPPPGPEGMPPEGGPPPPGMPPEMMPPPPGPMPPGMDPALMEDPGMGTPGGESADVMLQQMAQQMQPPPR